MPSYMHPRSIHTTSLFTTTLAISFLVVGLPHILPCPVPARQLADGEMDGVTSPTQRRRLQQQQQLAEANGEINEKGTIMSKKDLDGPARECPVPKPRGVIGRMLGFGDQEPRERQNVRVESADLKSGEKR